MITKRLKRFSLVGGTLALAVGATLLASKADARAIGGFAGNPLDLSPASCFAESFGGVTGTGAANCVGVPFPDSPRWEIALPTDTNGTFTVNVGLRGNGTQGPTCTVYKVDQLSGIIIGSTTVTNSSTNFVVQPTTISSVPVGGFIVLACGHLVDANTRVGSVNW